VQVDVPLTSETLSGAETPTLPEGE
jgi:hypothetical protein